MGFLIGFLLLFGAAYANITGQNPAAGTCLCISGTSVHVRDNPGIQHTHILTSLNSGACHKFHGGVLTKDGYTWYQLQHVVGHNGWVAGNYLNTASSSHCSGHGGSSGSGGSCNSAHAKQLACKILNLHNNGKISLWDRHPSGHHDKAYALNNIQDACHGHAASRSSYACSLCRTSNPPGGHVCLSMKLLEYLYAIASTGYVHVNEIAGACHGCNSYHYAGQAVDLHRDGRHSEYMSKCRAMGGGALDEGDHIHCTTH